MRVGISTVGSWQSPSLMRVGSYVLSRHPHSCHSHCPLVLSLDRKLPGMDAM